MLLQSGFLYMPFDGRHLHNRQHGKFPKRHLTVALAQFLQQHGNGKSAGTFSSRITIGMRTLPSWEALNPYPET